MNRYTYKAKRKDNSEWVYGYLVKKHFRKGEWQSHMEYEYYIETGEFNKSSFNEISFEIIPETLCQCTGLQDRDGKDIFENDIILFDETWKYQVFFKDITWQILRLDNNATRDLYYFRNRTNAMFKIIGNTFDKKED